MKNGRRSNHKNMAPKYLTYISLTAFLVLIISFVVTYIVYSNKLKNSASSLLSTEDLIGLSNYESGNTQTASLEIGKTINQISTSNNLEVEDEQKEITEEKITKEIVATADEVKIVEPEFIWPVDGETTKEFAKDSLIYSDTLEEWITHLGIDIKADRTTIVKASEGGIILSIKSDPRYGLTIIIEHENNYKTVYSNLLTSEFVKEGEKIEKGQSIGTVGNSSAFEVLDEPHLHFEIIKDGENLDPLLYLK